MKQSFNAIIDHPCHKAQNLCPNWDKKKEPKIKKKKDEACLLNQYMKKTITIV